MKRLLFIKMRYAGVTPLPAREMEVPIQPLTKVDQAQRRILKKLFLGRIKPGDRLVEADIAQELGVSQATINNALHRLDAQGIVTKSLARETRVCQYGTVELNSIFGLRAVLECLAAEAIARLFTQESADELRQFVDQMRIAARNDDLPGFYLADYDFHQTFYRQTKDRFLIQACDAIAAAPFAYILCSGVKPIRKDYILIAEDHEEIIQGLLRGPERAAEVVRQKVGGWLRWQSEFVTPPAPEV